MSWNENMLEEHSEKVPAELALGLCLLASFIVMSFLFCRHGGQKGCKPPCLSPQQDLPKMHQCLYITCCVFLLVTVMTFSTYSGFLFERDAQDYQGPMRIQGVSFEQRTESRKSSSSSTRTYTTYYDAVMDVEWGAAWACPDHGNVVCRSTVTPCIERVCGSRECSDKATEEAFDALLDCSRLYFDEEQSYIPYNTTAGPSADAFWPSIVGFGDCDACTSTVSVASIDAISRIKFTGFCFAGVTALLWIALVVVLKSKRAKNANSIGSAEGTGHSNAGVEPDEHA